MILGSKFIFRDTIGSTNALAAKLLKEENIPEGTVIHSNYQTAGKGQPGNHWESEPGKNILMSIVLYPHFVRPDDQFIISMAVSTGIYDFLKPKVKGCTIKWPNDIYVKDDKIAGILIENSIMGDTIQSTVAGIGLNVNQLVFPGTAPNATSLRMITGKDYDLSGCLKELVSKIDIRYRQILSDRMLKIRNEYISSLYGLMRWRDFRRETGIFRGRIISVTDSGRLMVEDEEGSVRDYGFREIDFILH